MRYMLLIYTNETASAQRSAGERQECMNHHLALMEEATRAGVLRATDPLHPTTNATTVRVLDGKPVVTDGPFAETKEQLGGYYILDCRDLDEAISWANKMKSSCIEIRPILEIAQLQEQLQQALARAV